MGHLLYGVSTQHIEFDDRVLAHLQVLAATKLRRKEGFWLSWAVDAYEGIGHTAIWIDHKVALAFRFRSQVPQPIDREWIEDMLTSANNRGSVDVQKYVVSLRDVLPAAIGDRAVEIAQ